MLTLFNIAIFQGFVLGIIILRSPIFRSGANKYLAYGVIGLSFSLLSLALELTDAYGDSLLLHLIDAFTSGTLFPVLIFLFIINKVNHPFRHDKNRWWLFAPHILSVSLSLLNLAIEFDGVFVLLKVAIDAVDTLLFLFTLFFIPGLLLYAYSFIKYADGKREKSWLTHLWFWVTAIMVSWVSSIFFAMLSLIDFVLVMEVIALGAAFLIHWITYVGIFQFRLSKDQEEIRALISKWKGGTVKAVSSPLSPSIEQNKLPVALTEENAHFKKLESLFSSEQVYLDNTLDRAKVAAMLGISPGYVSQLVNTITGENFSTYTNRYRVEAVKAMIADPEFEGYSLLAIGLESGFSSKSTFHNTFKKMTGLTPNGYRKTHQ